MSSFVLGFQEIDKTKLAIVGGKGANLNSQGRDTLHYNANSDINMRIYSSASIAKPRVACCVLFAANFKSNIPLVLKYKVVSLY